MLPIMAYGDFRYSISSDVVWPQRSVDQPDLSHRIEPIFNENEFKESLESKIIVTLLIRKNGTVEDVIPALGKSDEVVLSRLCDTLKKWKFHPSESEQTVVFSFIVKIETEEPTSR
jgi:hypothetical protein